MGLGTVIKAAGKASDDIGGTVAARSSHGLPFLADNVQDNTFLFAIGFAICAVVVIFVLYKIFKRG